jgi:uncharacterized protein (TIGR03435 family)
MTTSEFAGFLTRLTSIPVVDRIGLDGTYLFSFDIYPFGRMGEDGTLEGLDGGDFIEFFGRHYDDALAPLGLRVTHSKAPLMNVIVDHLDRDPTEN